MKIAVVSCQGLTFEQMFAKWSPFFSEGRCKYWTYLLKKSFEAKGIELCAYREDEIMQYDSILYFGALRKDIMQKVPQVKHIYCAGEPSIVYIANSKKNVGILAEKVYDAVLTSYSDVDCSGCYHFIFPHDFPEQNRDPKYAWKDRKLACMFSADKYALGKKELYTERRRIVCYFEKNAPDAFGLYGRRWIYPFCNFQVYKGPVDDAFSTAQEYKFTFCLENERFQNGCISEKIIDAMLTGNVPVYDGADDIQKFIPEDCFIPYRKFDSVEECAKVLQNMTEEQYNTYQNNINQFLSTAYKNGLFSADAMRDQILRVCKECTIKRLRALWVLDWFRFKQKTYNFACRVNKALDLVMISLKMKVGK